MTPQEALIKISNCQTQVGLPISKFKRKEVKTLKQNIDAKDDLVEIMKSCIELLNQDGINSKQIVKEILKTAVKKIGGTENGTMKISEKQITQIKRYIESKGNIKLSDSLLRKMEMKGLRLQFDEIVNGRKNDKDKK